MDCAVIVEDLLPYHFASTTEEEKDRIDAHLLSCSSCLKAYLALKRRIESGGTEKPSDELRLRLRANVERKFRTGGRARVSSFLRKRIPVYQGVAAAAIAAAITLGVPAAIHAVRTQNEATEQAQKTEPRVDSARRAAESDSIF